MAKALVMLVLAGCAAAVLAAPAGRATRADSARTPASQDARPPDGRLVLAVLSPERVIVADPRTGRSHERVLAGGTLCHGPVLAVGDRVVLGGARGSTPVALSLPLSLRGRGRSLGRAHTFAAADGRVVVGRWTRLRSATAHLAVRTVDLDGAGGATASVEVPRWSALEGAVGDDLLVSHDGTLALWRPGGAPPRAIGRGWPIAVDGARVAWCPRGCRTLRVWSAGATTTIEPPPGMRIEEGPGGALAPDGRLAVPLRGAHGVQVGVFEPAARRWRVLPRARLGSYRALAWSPSGAWLYVAARGERLLAWRPGAERPVRLPIRTRGTVMSIATVRGG